MQEATAASEVAARQEKEKQQAEAAARAAALEKEAAEQALFAPVVDCLDNGFVKPANCTRKFAELVQGRFKMGIASSPNKVTGYQIKKYNVRRDGASATVDAVVRFTDRGGNAREQLITYYLQRDGDRWLLNLIDYTDR